MAGYRCYRAFSAGAFRLANVRHSQKRSLGARPATRTPSGRIAAGSLQCRADASRAAAFPAGKRQARVELPACFVSISVEDAINDAEKVGAAVSAGATGVLLVDEADAGVCPSMLLTAPWTTKQWNYCLMFAAEEYCAANTVLLNIGQSVPLNTPSKVFEVAFNSCKSKPGH